MIVIHIVCRHMILRVCYLRIGAIFKPTLDSFSDNAINGAPVPISRLQKCDELHVADHHGIVQWRESLRVGPGIDAIVEFHTARSERLHVSIVRLPLWHLWQIFVLRIHVRSALQQFFDHGIVSACACNMQCIPPVGMLHVGVKCVPALFSVTIVLTGMRKINEAGSAH
jgi:hypothetical protein